MFFYKMLQHKKCSAFVFSVLCILIQVTETADKHWNEECYSKNDCYKLLENGTKFTWPEAYDLCRKEKGYLLNDTWITTLGMTKRFKLLQSLVNGSDTWTSLQLVNYYIQEVSKYTSYAQSAREIQEKHSVWPKDTCIKLTQNNTLQVINCTAKLPVVCASDLEELNKEVSDCNIQLKPILTAKVSGKSVDTQNGHVELKVEDRKNVIFYCEGLESKPRIDWIKDGVYLKRRMNIIQPAITVDPSKENNNNYSMQGTYWCEAWTPGCSQKFSSNKVNLTFEGIITTHAHWQLNSSYNVGDTEDGTKMNENFQLCGNGRIITSDVRKGYTDVRNITIATDNFHMYINNDDLTCDVNQYILKNANQLSAIGVVKYGISFLPVCLRKSSVWQAVQKRCSNSTSEDCRACPQHFTLLKPYCVRVTKPKTWISAYEGCFHMGIEKTPLDIKSFWMDADLLDNLICFLREQHINYIWLAAERKLDGGPVYYSGPVASDFSYSFNETEEYNISWTQSDYNVNNKCLALNIEQKTLQILSCESTLPFVCLFPSEFWTHNVTYDSFHICHENCSEDYKLEGGIPWGDAREKCRQNGGNLIQKQSSYFRNHSYLYNSNININYIGKQNTEKPNSDTSLQHNFIQWFGSDIQKVYHLYNRGFLIENTSEVPREYACLSGQAPVVPRIYINETSEGNYTINMYDLEEASYAYGIKCYLNGKHVKLDKCPDLSITQQGYLFCEVLTHLPVLLLKSNVILVQNPNVLTFACQIFDPSQSYDFKLHDFSLHSESEGSISYYRKLLNGKLSGSEVSVQNISASSYSPGIYVDFHIEIYSHESKLKQIFVNISNVIRPSGTEVKIGTRKVNVSYVRSTKYCMEEITKVEPNTSNCTKATWPVTLINKETITLERCVTCGYEVLKRACLGNFNTGAKWGPIKKLHLSSSQDSKKKFYVCEDVLYAVKKIISDTVNSITKNVSESLKTYNSTNEFLRKYENFLVGKNVNGTVNETDIGLVSIYSMSLRHDILRFVHKENDESSIIKAAEKNETDEDVTVAIYFTPNITAEYSDGIPVLISVFENTVLFPEKIDHLKLNSPVILINITDDKSIKFPIKMFFNLNISRKSSEGHICAFWNEETSKWDEDGCKYNGTTSTGLHECLYYHLSCFAMLLRVDDSEHFASLDILSRVGCYLSLIGLTLVLLTFIFVHRWRTYLDNKIIASLSVSLFLMYLLFVTGFTQTSNEFVCIGIGASLHYFVLSSFCWMFVEAYHNYLKFVKVIGTYIPRFMWKASASAWGSPLIPVIGVFCYNYKLYKDEHYCWVHSEAFYFALLTPLALTCGANMIIFIFIISSVTCARQQLKNNQQQYSLLISQLKMSFCIFILLGLSWIFGFLALAGAGVIFSYLFCITSTLQGFLIFLFFILLGKRKRGIWQELFCHCYSSKHLIMKDSSTSKTQTSLIQTSL